MPEQDKERLFRLRVRSKKGDGLCNADHDFCRSMFEKYPKEYVSMRDEVFQASKPFGSKA